MADPCPDCQGLLWVEEFIDGEFDGMLPCPTCRAERRRYHRARVARIEADWEASQASDRPGPTAEEIRDFARKLQGLQPLTPEAWVRDNPDQVDRLRRMRGLPPRQPHTEEEET
jgi:hypothetical protein